MTQAQAVANFCHQRCKDIDAQLQGVNNASKILEWNGKDYTQVKAKPLPTNFVHLLDQKGKYHATQAFLMENIRLKGNMLEEIQGRQFVFDLPKPEPFDMDQPVRLRDVSESWGWNQLTTSQYNEYLEAEAMASHIGQFIHKDGKLTNLRRELDDIPSLEWFSVETGKRVPVQITTHHTAEDLLNAHEELAGAHRKWEQRVNYFKAKVKNLVSDENARRASENSKVMEKHYNSYSELQAAYEGVLRIWNDKKQKASEDFEVERNKDTKLASSLRIQVDGRFKPTVDEALALLDKDE